MVWWLEKGEDLLPNKSKGIQKLAQTGHISWCHDLDISSHCKGKRIIFLQLSALVLCHFPGHCLVLPPKVAMTAVVLSELKKSASAKTLTTENKEDSLLH